MEPGACEAGQRGALASDHPWRGARVVQSHYQRRLSVHEIPPASMPGGGASRSPPSVLWSGYL